MKKSHFRYWELALLLALAVTILWGTASLGQQEELGRKVIRLHVIAPLFYKPRRGLYRPSRGLYRSRRDL